MVFFFFFVRVTGSRYAENRQNSFWLLLFGTDIWTLPVPLLPRTQRVESVLITRQAGGESASSCASPHVSFISTLGMFPSRLPNLLLQASVSYLVFSFCSRLPTLLQLLIVNRVSFLQKGGDEPLSSLSSTCLGREHLQIIVRQFSIMPPCLNPLFPPSLEDKLARILHPTRQSLFPPIYIHNFFPLSIVRFAISISAVSPYQLRLRRNFLLSYNLALPLQPHHTPRVLCKPLGYFLWFQSIQIYFQGLESFPTVPLTSPPSRRSFQFIPPNRDLPHLDPRLPPYSVSPSMSLSMRTTSPAPVQTDLTQSGEVSVSSRAGVMSSNSPSPLSPSSQNLMSVVAEGDEVHSDCWRNSENSHCRSRPDTKVCSPGRIGNWCWAYPHLDATFNLTPLDRPLTQYWKKFKCLFRFDHRTGSVLQLCAVIFIRSRLLFIAEAEPSINLSEYMSVPSQSISSLICRDFINDGNELSYKCKKCGRIIKNNSNARRHVRVEFGRPYIY